MAAVSPTCSVGGTVGRTLAEERRDRGPFPVPSWSLCVLGKYCLSRVSADPSIKLRREVEMGLMSQHLSSRHFP